MSIQEGVKNFLLQYCGNLKGRKILVACSGGPDSMALLKILQNLSSEDEFLLGAVHLEHGIRGEVSRQEATFVRNYCREKQIVYYEKAADIPALAKARHQSLELVAREIRYEFMAEVFRNNNYDYLATGHHLNDQGETVLLHLLRGTGPKGLQGIKPIIKHRIGETELTIIRPLLKQLKSDILHYCENEQLEYCQDMTNYSTDYRRNKIRWELLPYLEEYNPRILYSLSNLSELMQLEMDYLSSSMEEAWENTVSFKDEETVIIDMAKMKVCHKFVRQWIWRRCYERIHGSLADLSSVHIAIAEEFLYNGSIGKVIELPHQIKIKKDYHNLVLGYLTKQETVSHAKVTVDMNALLSEGEFSCCFGERKLIFELFPEETGEITLNKNSAVVPLDEIRGEPVVRQRQNGDRIELVNLGLKKVKEIFINEKVPAAVRDDIPVIEDEQGIIWLAGVRCSVRCRKTTGKLLYIRLINI